MNPILAAFLMGIYDLPPLRGLRKDATNPDKIPFGLIYRTPFQERRPPKPPPLMFGKDPLARAFDH